MALTSDIYEWWKQLGQDVKENVKNDLDRSVQAQFDAMYDSIADEINDGIRGEWYTRLVRLVGKEKADKIYADIETSMKSTATPYVVGAVAVLLVVFLGGRASK